MREKRLLYTRSSQILIITVLFGVSYFLYNSKASKKDYNAKIEQITNLEPYEHSISSYNSTFNGYSKDLDPYYLKSVRASKINENEYILDDLTGNYLLDRRNIKLKANTGSIKDNELINLCGDVVIEYDDFISHSAKLDINLVNRSIIGAGRIEVSYQKSYIKADNFILLGNKNQSKVNNLQFNGNVSANIDLIDHKK